MTQKKVIAPTLRPFMILRMALDGKNVDHICKQLMIERSEAFETLLDAEKAGILGRDNGRRICRRYGPTKKRMRINPDYMWEPICPK